MSNRCVPFVRIKARPLINGADKSAPGIIPKETTGIVYKAAADCRCLCRSHIATHTTRCLLDWPPSGCKIRKDSRPDDSLYESLWLTIRSDPSGMFNRSIYLCPLWNNHVQKITSIIELIISIHSCIYIYIYTLLLDSYIIFSLHTTCCLFFICIFYHSGWFHFVWVSC